ncbi:MAG: SRPBCC family protein [Bacteroidota bacterium]|nr:SRPBCC family protein [Bacteroidota bacterium]
MLYTLETKQFINSDLDSVWDFMSSPKNLAALTPEHMGFEVLSKFEETKMYPGQIIEYYVSPLFNIKLRWVTEITHVKDKEYFVDEQRFGPYAFWHHQHFLKEVSGGVLMSDIVNYKLPLGPLGKIANALFVKHQLQKIFDYRFKKVDEIFKPK